MAVNALNSLLRGASIDDHDEVLRLANAAISAPGPTDGPDKLAAQHTKVVALLKLDRFDDALRIIAGAGDALAALCVLERAYALYKTGDLEAAARLASASGQTSRGLQHIAAQVAYRAEDFNAAANLYAQLAADADAHDEAPDVRINALATSAQRAWQGRGASTRAASQDAALAAGRRDDLESFETAYNAACVVLAHGSLTKALVLLQRARALCEASDELDDDDRRAELVPILVQQAYVLVRLGRVADAAAVQAEIDASALDGSARLVTATNALQHVADADKANPYLLQRHVEQVPADTTGSDRLFAYQARLLRRNQYAIELQCYKFKGVQARAGKLLKTFTTDAASPAAVDLGVLGAAAKAELATGKDALRTLLPHLQNRPTDVGLLLTAVQQYLGMHNAEAALGLVETFFAHAEAHAEAADASARFAPGLVALAVALYRLQGRHAAARAALHKAVTHWQAAADRETPETPKTPASLLRAAGVELLASTDAGEQAAATSAFEALYAADPLDRVAVAGLVASLAASGADTARRDTLAASLAPVASLVQGIDVASLLASGVATVATTATATPATPPKSKKRAADATSEATDAKKAKTGKPASAPVLSRQAKKLQAKAAAAGEPFDTGKALDAERWLPLRDRSSYRPPKGKKGKRRAADTMQGGVVKEEETLVLAGGAGSVKVEKAPSGSSKKKKKGKK